MKAALALALALVSGAAQAQCRHALVLALDISGSVDQREYRLQLDGVAVALSSDTLRPILLGDPDGYVALGVFEWSAPDDQHLILPWTDLEDAAAIDRAAARLLAHRRQPSGWSTGIGPAMLRGFEMLAARPDCARHTLDISGDGEANNGVLPQHVSTQSAPPGTIVNALVVGKTYIGTDPFSTADLSDYFATHVLRGEDAFVERADSYDDYAKAMTRKLVRELRVIPLSKRQ